MRLIQGIITVLLVMTTIIGDYVVFHSKYSESQLFRAITDSLTHAAVGCVSAVLFFSYNLNISTHPCLNSVIFCTLLSAVIDIDHVIVARSLRIKDMMNLKVRGIFHCTTFWLLITTAIFLYSYIEKKLNVYILGFIVLMAYTSHHLRDANRRAPRTSCTGGTPNNLPPLSFHSVHGENVRISRDGTIARRVESFCKGVAFSARPVRVNEKVCIRFVEISNSWSGVIRFGFTSHDPTSIAHSLPKYACPDLTNKPGNWAKALGERFCEKDNILYYYVNSTGDVHFGINGEDKGLFFSGVDTRNPLWALVDVYGNCTAVQFADPRAPNQRRPTQSPLEDDRLVSGMRAMTVEDALPAPRFQNPLVPLSLHRTKGRNVQFINDRGVAARIEAEFCQGYVFTARPMRPGQTIVVQILATEAAYAGSLAIGLTSCDPSTLRPCDLPDDAELLLDRPEYWVVRRDAANGLRRGDELAVTLTVDGEVRVSRNGTSPVTVMHVDHTLRLWAFVDIYGATQKVRMLSSQAAQTPPQQLRVLTGSAAPIVTGAGGTVLVVSLPPQNGGQVGNHQQALTLASAHYIEPLQSTQQLCLAGLQPIAAQPATCQQYQPRPRSDAQCSSTQNSTNEQAQMPNGHGEPPRLPERITNGPSTSRQNHQPVYSVIPEGTTLTGTECTICYENPIDSVLYMCGHMCMCYRCAVQQWRGKGGGQCPLCRAQIKDVIRTYKS